MWLHATAFRLFLPVTTTALQPTVGDRGFTLEPTSDVLALLHAPERKYLPSGFQFDASCAKCDRAFRLPTSHQPRNSRQMPPISLFFRVNDGALQPTVGDRGLTPEWTSDKRGLIYASLRKYLPSGFFLGASCAQCHRAFRRRAGRLGTFLTDSRHVPRDEPIRSRDGGERRRDQERQK